MARRNSFEIINVIIIILLIVFGIFLIYQIIMKLIGGSWTNESIMTSLTMLILASLFVIVGFLINQARCLGGLESDFRNFKSSFLTLAHDFKEHIIKKRH